MPKLKEMKDDESNDEEMETGTMEEACIFAACFCKTFGIIDWVCR